MDDLNDLFYFVQVVDHAGFTPAGRALGMPKSKLSRRIAALERHYDVRLLQRTTRHFSVTETGQEFYQQCQAVLAQAQSAREVLERHRSEPRGVVRVSCPTALLEYRIGPLVARFMKQCPQVRVLLEATNRRVDVLAEGFDIALRVRFPPLESSELVMRVLADSPQRLVASPALLKPRKGYRDPQALKAAGLPSLDWGPPREHAWHLEGPGGAQFSLAHAPRYITDDMTALRQAALAGIGVVQLPCMVVEDALARGALIDVLPGWAPKGGVIHAVFPSRRGVLPGVRMLLDFLAANIQQD